MTTLLAVFLSRQTHKQQVLWLMPPSCAHFIVSCSHVCLARAKCTNNNNVVGIVYNILLPISAVGYFQAPRRRLQMVANFLLPPPQRLGNGGGCILRSVLSPTPSQWRRERLVFITAHRWKKYFSILLSFTSVQSINIYTRVRLFVCPHSFLASLLHAWAGFLTWLWIPTRSLRFRA